MKKIILIFLFFVSLTLVNAYTVNNSVPEITLVFNESVLITDYSLKGTFFGNTTSHQIQRTKISNKIFLFKPTEPLNDGSYIFRVAATDLVNNTFFGEYPIEVNAGMNIFLKVPRYGVARQSPFDLVIGTGELTEQCKYDTNGFNYPFAEQKNSEYFFTTTDYRTHRVTDFSKLQGAQERTELKIYVKCKTRTGVINENSPKVFTLSIDSTIPIILSKYFLPDEVIYPPPESELYVETDDKTICKYSKENVEYTNLDYGFDNWYAEIFSPINQVTIADLKDGPNTFYFSCMNAAELPSPTQSITIYLNYNAPNLILKTEPSGIINNKSITLTVITNKPAACSYEDASQRPRNLTQNLKKTTHTDLIRSLSSKNYTYYVSCIFVNIDGTTEKVEAVMNFTVDWTAPSSILISPYTYSCTNEKVKANISSFDANGVDYYEAWITNKTDYVSSSIKVIRVLNNIPKVEAEITGLNLHYGELYYWNAKAYDLAGNPSSPVKSPTSVSIIDNSSSDIRCREKIPPTATLKKKYFSGGVNVTIECFDSGSDCNEDTFKYQLINPGLTCGNPVSYLQYKGSVLVYRNQTFCYYVCDIAQNCVLLNESIRITEISEDDRDGDGLSNDDEVNKYFTDPDKFDTDGDGLSDGEEVNIYHTDPNKKDTDGDGFFDGVEIEEGTNPNDPNDYPGKQEPRKEKDVDGDGIDDEWELLHCDNGDCDPDEDSDNDGLTNLEEFRNGTDPNNSDTDGDGYSDGDEVNIYFTDPNDPNDYPGKEGKLLPLLLLIMGILLILAGSLYLIYDFFIRPESSSKKERIIYRTGERAPAIKQTEQKQEPARYGKIMAPDRTEIERRRKEIAQRILEKRKEKKKSEKERAFEGFEETKEKKEQQKDEIKKLEVRPVLKAGKERTPKEKRERADKKLLFQKLDRLGMQDEGFQKLSLLIQEKEQPLTENKKTEKVRYLKEKQIIEPVKEKEIEKIIVKAKPLPELKTQRAVKASEEDIFKKLSKFTGEKEPAAQKILKKERKVKRQEIFNVFADLSENKPITGDLFKQILNHLLETGKISKSDVSKILFDYMEKDLISKAEVADILASLRMLK